MMWMIKAPEAKNNPKLCEVNFGKSSVLQIP